MQNPMLKTFLNSQPAGWFPIEQFSLLQLSGADRHTFLNGFSTNNIKELSINTACETFIPSIQGKVLGHSLAISFQNSLVLAGIGEQSAQVSSHLNKYIITEDVEITDTAYNYVALFAYSKDIEALKHALHSHHLFSEYSGVGNSLPTGHLNALCVCPETEISQTSSAYIVCIEIEAMMGYLIILPLEGQDGMISLLAEINLQKLTIDEAHCFRISLGLPYYGVDISSDNLAQEVCRSSTAISFEKGCYLGQEPIARIDALGHVNKKLRQLVLLDAGTEPQAWNNSKLFDLDTSKEVGIITSVSKHIVNASIDSTNSTEPGNMQSPKVTGLGIVHRHSSSPGNTLKAVNSQNESCMAEVQWINDE